MSQIIWKFYKSLPWSLELFEFAELSGSESEPVFLLLLQSFRKERVNKIDKRTKEKARKVESKPACHHYFICEVLSLNECKSQGNPSIMSPVAECLFGLNGEIDWS